MPFEPGSLVFEAENRQVEQLVVQAKAAASVAARSCFTLLDAYAREEGLFQEAPKGIQVEANKVAGGNFFWASPPQALRFGELHDVSTDGDLLTIGALGMGLDDAFLKKFLAHAVKAAPEEEEDDQPLVGALEALEGLVSLKECPGGYELYSFDLKAFGKRSGLTHDVVVVVPDEFCGVPLVRLNKDAFARRYVQGVDVALLVLPDTVEELPEGVLSCIAARNVYLGEKFKVLRPQPCDLGLFSPKLASRRYLVAEGNTAFAREYGALCSADGASLYFLEPPYGQHVTLPEGVGKVEPHAFCSGTPAPEQVWFPPTLEAASPGAFERAVWVGTPGARLRSVFARQHVRTASPSSIQEGPCLYDTLDDATACLVAGPPPPLSASQRWASGVRPGAGKANAKPSGQGSPSHTHEPTSLSIPDTVAGCKVVAVADNAMPYAPDALSIPGCVTRIGDGNMAKGAKRLALSEGLRHIGADCFVSRSFEEVVDIPRSVSFIGLGSFQYALCRFPSTGAIVHVPADPLRSPFGRARHEGAPFDLAAYDEALVANANLRDRLGARVHRLAMREGLEGAARRHVVEYLEADIEATLSYVAREGSTACIDAIEGAGLLEGARREQLVELLRAGNRMDCVMHLLQRADAGQSATSRSRFAL